MNNLTAVAILSFAWAVAFSARAEAPFAFRDRLVEVHRPNRCDRSLSPVEGKDYAFVDGCVVPDADFADYLNVSMNVKARVGADGAVTVRIDPTLDERAYRVEVGRHGVVIVAKDERARAQAFYHLEDLMNLRRAPFLRYGVESRRMRFSPRMLHSGYDVDVFPDGHLAQMAHYGFDAIAVFMKTPEKSESASGEVDVDDIIRRAKAHGLDTYLYTKIKAFVHPSDPKAPEVFANTYGKLARLHPDAKGVVFVGESCEFPSKDPRTTGRSYKDTAPGDLRPPPGWFPCSDYPDWINAVKAAVQREAPQMEIVFWTYNWGPQPANLRVPMVEKFPRDVIMQGTYYKTPADPKRNGLCLPCEDYTISFAGPGGNVVEESAAAKRSGKRFYAMTNTGGLTWDFGCAPYEPFPYQWKKRFDGMVKMNGEGRLAGLMESHHYGWYPNFIAELAKEAFTEGGLPFDEHLRAIAVREFGEANADKALAAWKAWSEAIVDYPGTNDNQYGPFRLGPAYPFNFGGPTVAPVFTKDKAPTGSVPFPQPKGVMHPMTWMCDLNWCGAVGDPSASKRRTFDRGKEVELLSAMVGKLDEGTRLFKSMSGAGAAHMANLGEYLTRSTVTGVNVKRGCLVFLAGDTNRLAAIARDEYVNAQASLPVLARDSRLGWEPSMGYAGGAETVRWKLGLMRKVYGLGEARRCGGVAPDVSELPGKMRFVGDLLTVRVGERIGKRRDAASSLRVRYVLDAQVPGEEAHVTVKGMTAEVRAGRLRGLLAGTGNLLKAFRYSSDSFVAFDGSYDFCPQKSLRIAYLARHFMNPFMEMGADEFCRYVDDLVLDGINAFNTQLGVPTVDAARIEKDERELFLETSRRVGARISELDCTLVVSGGGNQLPTDSPEEYRAEPNINPKCPPTGFNACPAKPRALAELLRRRKTAVENLRGRYDVGYFTNWPYDEGGCGCKTCRPWGGNGYLKLIERFRDINSSVFPDAKRIVSTWFFDDDDYAGLWKYLETNDWIDYLLVDDFGEKYPEWPLAHPIPNRKTRIITFPEISMWGRVPWGGYGATALPKFLESLFRQSERIADGFEYYSEGIYEDINKAIVTGLYVNPADSTDAILRRYGAYHFAGADPDDFVALANLLERNHRQTLMTRENVAAAKALAEKIDREMLPSLRGTWRWRLVWLRAMLDDRPENRHYDELVRLYHAERQLRWVLDGKMGGWTCPRYVPDGAGCKTHAPPEGDATEVLQKLLDDPSLVEVRLGPGVWRHGPLVLRRSRFDLVLEEGCRLSAAVTIASNVNGATVRGDHGGRVRVEDGAKNVIVDGQRIDTPEWNDEPWTDRAAEIRRIDRMIEWAEQHGEKEKVEFLKMKLRNVQGEAK